MTSDLDAKGPAVHLNEHNPERDIPGTHTAPQPDNDPSGIGARVIRLAQQFEDQHAPQHMTLLLREAAAEIERGRTALREIASGKYSGIVLPTYPPQDPAVNAARAALAAPSGAMDDHSIGHKDRL